MVKEREAAYNATTSHVIRHTTTIMRLLLKSDRGATAIEYAIIAGLIGIGLIGSLVTTRGSLSSIFGTASSQMASAGSGQSQAGTMSDYAQYWAAKTVSSASTTNGQTTFNYSDGSRALYTPTGSGPNGTLMTYDKLTREVRFTTTDASGKLTQFEVDVYYPNSSVYQTTSYASTSFNTIQNGVITGQTNYVNNPDGSRQTTQVGVAPASTFVDQSTASVTLLPYFQTLKAARGV